MCSYPYENHSNGDKLVFIASSFGAKAEDGGWAAMDNGGNGIFLDEPDKRLLCFV